MLAILLSMQLGAAGLAEAREEARFRAGVHFAFPGGVSGFAFGFGPGVSAEVGGIWGDRFSVAMRATVGTIFVVSIVTGGVAFEFSLSDRFNLGITPSIAAVGGILFGEDLPLSITAFAPMRLTFAPSGRTERDVRRRGLTIFAEAGPGYALVMNAGLTGPGGPMPSRVSVMGAIGVGYSIW